MYVSMCHFTSSLRAEGNMLLGSSLRQLRHEKWPRSLKSKEHFFLYSWKYALYTNWCWWCESRWLWHKMNHFKRVASRAAYFEHYVFNNITKQSRHMQWASTVSPLCSLEKVHLVWIMNTSNSEISQTRKRIRLLCRIRIRPKYSLVYVQNIHLYCYNNSNITIISVTFSAALPRHRLEYPIIQQWVFGGIIKSWHKIFPISTCFHRLGFL